MHRFFFSVLGECCTPRSRKYVLASGGKSKTMNLRLATLFTPRRPKGTEDPIAQVAVIFSLLPMHAREVPSQSEPGVPEHLCDSGAGNLPGPDCFQGRFDEADGEAVAR